MKELEDIKVNIIRDRNTVFYSALMCNMDVHYCDSVPTAATNGLEIRISEQFFLNLPEGQRKFLMLHEIEHVAYMHTIRFGDRDKKLWQKATDYAINIGLVDAGYEFIPGGLLDEKYRGMSAEEIYAHLLDNEDEQPDDDYTLAGDLEPTPDPNDGEDQDGEGEDQDGNQPNDGGSSSGAAERKITEMVVAAAQQAEIMNAAGSIPANVARAIEEIVNPILPWDVLLDHYKQAKAKEDYSWAKRNRRFGDFIMPSLYSESMDKLAVYVDASCSVTRREMEQYVAEILDMKDALDPKTLEVVTFDTRIYDIQEICQGEEAHLTIKGGGGTCLTQVAERINEEDADVNIVLTDGYYTPVEYNKEVLHVIVNNKDYRNEDHPVIHIKI